MLTTPFVERLQTLLEGTVDGNAPPWRLGDPLERGLRVYHDRDLLARIKTGEVVCLQRETLEEAVRLLAAMPAATPDVAGRDERFSEGVSE